MKTPPLLAAAAVCLTSILSPSFTRADDKALVYLGTYTNAKSGSEGIYISEFDGNSGALSTPRLVAELANPSFLAIHPNRETLYAVSEVSRTDDSPGGSVTAYRIDSRTGDLEKLNQQPSGGAGPCHLSVEPAGRAVIVANYGGGSCAAYPIEEDGSLAPAGTVIQHEGSSINPKRQAAPHAHSANPSPDGKFAFVTDLGTDTIEIYTLDATKGTLAPHQTVKVDPGSGPRHFTFHPEGKFAWVINELALTLTGFRYDASLGSLAPIETIPTLPESERNQPGLSTAEVQVHPEGRFLYGSNRGHDSISVFRIDSDSGALAFVGITPLQQKTPRNFRIDPTGKYLLAAGQASNSIRVFAIDTVTGTLEPTPHEIQVGAPVCVRFLSRLD